MSFEFPSELVDKIMEEAKETIEDKLKRLSLKELCRTQREIRSYIINKRYEVREKYRPFKECFIKLIFNESGGYRPSLTKYGTLRKIREATILFEETINLKPEAEDMEVYELEHLLHRIDYGLCVDEDVLDKDKIEKIDCKEKYFKKGSKYSRFLTIDIEDIELMETIIDFPLMRFENNRGNLQQNIYSVDSNLEVSSSL